MVATPQLAAVANYRHYEVLFVRRWSIELMTVSSLSMPVFTPTMCCDATGFGQFTSTRFSALRYERQRPRTDQAVRTHRQPRHLTDRSSHQHVSAFRG